MVFYYVGLDLGQAQDYTALAVLEAAALDRARGGLGDFGVFFPEGVEPGGWVSPSGGPVYADVLAVNARYFKGPLAAPTLRCT